MITSGVPIFLLVIILFMAHLKWDTLVRIEYTQHRKDWIEDGGPTSLLWKPSESEGLAGLKATCRLWVRWLFQRPQWVMGDFEAGKYLREWRVLMLVFGVVLAIVVVVRIVRPNG